MCLYCMGSATHSSQYLWVTCSTVDYLMPHTITCHFRCSSSSGVTLNWMVLWYTQFVEVNGHKSLQPRVECNNISGKFISILANSQVAVMALYSTIMVLQQFTKFNGIVVYKACCSKRAQIIPASLRPAMKTVESNNICGKFISILANSQVNS